MGIRHIDTGIRLRMGIPSAGATKLLFIAVSSSSGFQTTIRHSGDTVTRSIPITLEDGVRNGASGRIARSQRLASVRLTSELFTVSAKKHTKR